MFWIHPLWQCVTILIGLYVFYMGWNRFAANSLGQKKPFLWKRHVNLGKKSLYMWIYGALIGGAAAWVKWRVFGVTGIHFPIGIIIVCLAIFGYWSGFHMDTHKKKRKVLPLIHGSNNLLLLLLSLLSMVTGIRVFLQLIL